MSALIGKLHSASGQLIAEVWASRANVEIEVTCPQLGVTPIVARNFAALLVRASEEVERMRSKSETEQD